MHWVMRRVYGALLVAMHAWGPIPDAHEQGNFCDLLATRASRSTSIFLGAFTREKFRRANDWTPSFVPRKHADPRIVTKE